MLKLIFVTWLHLCKAKNKITSINTWKTEFGTQLVEFIGNMWQRSSGSSLNIERYLDKIIYYFVLFEHLEAWGAKPNWTNIHILIISK